MIKSNLILLLCLIGLFFGCTEKRVDKTINKEGKSQSTEPLNNIDQFNQVTIDYIKGNQAYYEGLTSKGYFIRIDHYAAVSSSDGQPGKFLKSEYVLLDTTTIKRDENLKKKEMIYVSGNILLPMSKAPVIHVK
ncbi:MAG: hypothetical protein COA79_22180 [Planctomycetota bacterium]|nr:MAG: hypothetical protein COA79_22180 [Planctomycetota bacterium]